MIHPRNALSILKRPIMQQPVKLALGYKLRVLSLQGLHLHGILISTIDLGSLVNLPKSALINQLAQSIPIRQVFQRDIGGTHEGTLLTIFSYLSVCCYKKCAFAVAQS